MLPAVREVLWQCINFPAVAKVVSPEHKPQGGLL